MKNLNRHIYPIFIIYYFYENQLLYIFIYSILIYNKKM